MAERDPAVVLIWRTLQTEQENGQEEQQRFSQLKIKKHSSTHMKLAPTPTLCSMSTASALGKGHSSTPGTSVQRHFPPPVARDPHQVLPEAKYTRSQVRLAQIAAAPAL